MTQSTTRTFDDCEDAFDFCKYHVEMILDDVEYQTAKLTKQVKDGKLDDGVKTLDQIILFMSRAEKLMEFIPDDEDPPEPPPIYG